jgi:hypothetical protein
VDGVWRWRKMMEHYVLRLHRYCINALTQHGDRYNVCGALFKRNDHFPGNFW